MPLYVYKSSAGSGKTTTLVHEYLKIALSDTNAFWHILAITFTNKAAGEMKERVLEALKEINKAEYDVKQGEYAGLFEDIGVSEPDFLERARTLQHLILHNYDDFSISTIDSFVHRIIKTFATDVKLPQNFEVVVDKEDFVPDIVAKLFEKVGADKALTDIMVNFVLSQTENEKSYNINRELNKFVLKQIGEEGFQHLQKIDQLSTKDFAAIIDKLIREIASMASVIKKSGQNAIDLMKSRGLEVSAFFQTKNGIYGFFEKCSILNTDNHLPPKSYPLKSVNENKWASGKAKPAEVGKIDAIKNELVQYFNQINSVSLRYIKLKYIYKKIYALALTHEIRSIFVDYTDRTQKVHISEFNKRISNEIAGQPVPFIYERLGTKYRYFLIDEFQDTSLLQWQNLLPLIEESLAHNNFNMLVGDAKQAIYRFRNGEVELFVNLPKLYNHDGSQYMNDTERLLQSQYHEKQLNHNWRSDHEIVKFNNAFFDLIKQNQTEHIQSIYANHQQRLPDSKPKTGGYVAIDLIEAENTEEYTQSRLEKIKSQVDLLITKSYKKKDICVLTRTNKYAIEVASYLIENGYGVVSSESLLLSNAPEVRLIIASFYLIRHQTEPLYLADVVSNLLRIKGNESAFHGIFNKANDKLKNGLDEVFACLSMPVKNNEMAELPVYELAEYLTRRLELNKPVNIYLQYFLDFVFEAQQNGMSSLSSFLDLWELKKNKSFITMPDQGDAIKVMTVHKAKGLKFKSVIVDLINRSAKKGKVDFWTELNEPGIEELKIGVLPITKDLDRIGLSNIYQKEEEKTKLDFLNLIYVAFTRPVKALFINGHIHSGKASDAFTKYVLHFLTSMQLFEETKYNYEFGELHRLSNVLKTVNDSEIKVLTKMTSSSWEDQIKIAPANEVYWEAIDSKPARTYGNLIHAMLAQIEYSGDIGKVINRFKMAGLIDEAEAPEIESMLTRLVSHPDLKRFYEKGILVKNETELIDKEENNILLRPDRVVIDGDRLVIIDYKTGAKEHKHQKQIALYARAFEKLGYHKIQQKLVYLNETLEIVNVT